MDLEIKYCPSSYGCPFITNMPEITTLLGKKISIEIFRAFAIKGKVDESTAPFIISRKEAALLSFVESARRTNYKLFQRPIMTVLILDINSTR